MAHRSPGEGTVVQRRDGRWQASVMVEGKRRTVYGKTRAEATRKLSALKLQAGHGPLPDPGNRTVADLVAGWLAAVEPNLKPRTLSTYRDMCERYVLPGIGRVRLSRLSPDRVQLLYADLLGDGRNRTAQMVHNILHRAFALAVLWRWLPENPCDRVLRPTYRAERRNVWTAAELTAFLEGTDGHWLQPLWVFLLASGCRLGEALALRWCDVTGDMVGVARSGQYIEGEWTVTTPKTRAGTRTLKLSAEGTVALRRQRAQQAQWRLSAGAAWQSTELVFTGATGKPLQRSVVASALRRACAALGVAPVTPHGLRHLHASLLLSQGLSVPLVSQRLGHANPGITMAVYAHALERGDDAAAAAIGRALAVK